MTDWLGIHTARWRMSDMHGALLPVPDLTANVRLEDLMFLAVHWDSAGIPLHVGDRAVDLPGLSLAAGDTVLTLSGRATWDKDLWHLEASAAEVKSSQFHWTVEPPLTLTGDPHGVGFDRLLANDGAAHLAVTGRWAAPAFR